MKDLIERQAAIDVVRRIEEKYVNNLPPLIDKAEVQTELMMLPSVQPEIIRCKDCKYWIDHRCRSRYANMNDWRGSYDSCSYAKRREDDVN